MPAMPCVTFFLQSTVPNGRYSEYTPGEEVGGCLDLVSKIILKPAVLDLLVPAYERRPKAEQYRDDERSKNSRSSIMHLLTENSIVVRFSALSGSTGDFSRTTLDPGMRNPTIYVNEKLVAEIDKKHNTLLYFVLVILLLRELNHFVGMHAHPDEVAPPPAHAAGQHTLLGFVGGKSQVAGESGYAFAFEEAFLGGILTLLFENDEAANSYGNISGVAFVRSRAPVTPAHYLAQKGLPLNNEDAESTASQGSDETPEDDIMVEKRPDKSMGKGREHKRELDKGSKGRGEHEEENSIDVDKPLETRKPSGNKVGSSGNEFQLDTVTRVLLDSEADIGVIVRLLQTGKFELPLLRHKTLIPIESSRHANHTRFSWYVPTE